MTYHWWFNSSAHTKHELTVTASNAAQNMPGKIQKQDIFFKFRVLECDN